MQITKFKQLDQLTIEEIIKLPYFYSLTKRPIGEWGVMVESSQYWVIVFKCNRLLADGVWGLLDEQFNQDFIIRYKIVDFNPEKKTNPLTTKEPKRKST